MLPVSQQQAAQDPGMLRDEPRKPKCKRRLKTPRTKKNTRYSQWDGATARPGSGARTVRKSVLTTARNARKGRY